MRGPHQNEEVNQKVGDIEKCVEINPYYFFGSNENLFYKKNRILKVKAQGRKVYKNDPQVGYKKFRVASSVYF